MSNDQGKMSCNYMKVEIQCKKWIKPATPTPFHLQKLKLSSIDQRLPPMFVQPIFYYSRETEEFQTTQAGRLLDLEESLSKVLTLYYPFAGRIYDEDNSLVSCQDQGVAFVVAKVDRKLGELVDGEFDQEVLFSELDSLHSSNPLVVVQVNIFKCEGLAIGLGVSRKLGDMFTIATFMNAWATTCRLGTLDNVVPPSFSFSSLLPAAPRIDFHFPKPLTSPKYVMKRFIYTGEAIAKIRSSIPESYTRVQLVMALITKSLANMEQTRPKPLVISQSMNLRSRTGLLIEENSCGNIFTLVLTTCGKLNNELLSWEVPELAKLIKNTIKNVADEMREVRDCSELYEKVVKGSVEFQQVKKKGESVNLVIFTSWCRFSLYEVDFGWGRPTLVSTVPTIANCVYLMDCKSDIAGIEALVCLKEEDMACF